MQANVITTMITIMTITITTIAYLTAPATWASRQQQDSTAPMVWYHSILYHHSILYLTTNYYIIIYY